MNHILRTLVLPAVAVLALLLTSPALAQPREPGNPMASPTPRAGVLGIRFAGQITGVLGPDASPTGITMQLQNDRTVTVRFAPRTVLKARSAEAQVEGLTVSDFAVVQAVRVGLDWSARRVLFDVDPFGPIRFFTVTGSVSRLNRAGTQVLLTFPGGATRWIILTRATRYAVDGVPTDSPPVLERTNVLQVYVHVTPRGWVADAINIRTLKTPTQTH